MNKKKAKALEKELMGHTIDGYEIVRFINNGKSAAVFEAKDANGTKVALKIFDEELIGLTGQEIQERRINQELSLKDHTIKGLVKIISGGKYKHIDDEYHYIVMEFVEGKNLKEYIETEEYNEDFIKQTLKSLIAITEELIKLGLAHRDIKPENIMINIEGELILMDLGVLKLIGQPNTENENTEKQFLATQRYSPPELFFGEVVDNVDNWRAINFYQIGGVLHDLIMKKEMYHGISPYGNIVRAIQYDIPKITSESYSDNLIHLTRSLLIKEANHRLQLASLKKIDTYLAMDNEEDSFEKELLKNRALSDGHKVKALEINRIKKTNEEIVAARRRFLSELTKTMQDVIEAVKKSGIFNEYMFGEPFSTQFTNKNEPNKYATINLPIKITASLELGLPRILYINFNLMIDELGLCKVSTFAFFAGTGIREELKEFDNMILQILNPNQNIPKRSGYNIAGWPRPTLNTNWVQTPLFEGVYSNDGSTERILKTKLAKLINKAIELTQEETEANLEAMKARHEGRRSNSSFAGSKTIIINLSE